MKNENGKWKTVGRIGVVILGLILTSQATFAKDKISVGLEFGADGYEAKFTQSTKISDSTTVSMPYTKTIFNPDFRLRFDLPIMDIRENCFLNMNFGTGLTLGLSSYENETKASGTTEKEKYNNYIFFWNFELGLKYYLTSHISLLADFTVSIPFITLHRDASYTKTQSGKTTTSNYADTNTHGLSSPHFCPKVGIIYTF